MTTVTTANPDFTPINPTEQLSHFNEFLESFGDSFVNYLPTLVFAIAVLVLGMIAAKLTLKLLKKGIDSKKADATLFKFLYSIVKIILYTVIFSSVLTILGIPSASIFAVIGTAGVAIGLALKDSLSNVAGGFIIMLEKPFRIGDRIISNGQEGIVRKITILYTVIDTDDNKTVFIPNSAVSLSTLVNATGSGIRRVDIDFSVSYNNDFETVRKAILETAAADSRILKKPAPVVNMTSHGESAIIATSKVWVKSKDYFDVRFSLYEQVKKAFAEAGVEIPYNQLDVHIIEK